VLREAADGRPEVGDASPDDLEAGDFLAADASQIVFVGGSPRQADAIVRIDLANGREERLRTSDAAADPSAVSAPRTIEYPTAGGETAYAFFYAPPPDARAERAIPGALSGHAPPLIVSCHGGPTGAASARLNLEVQFWTSRGFAVADVNYRGSSGFGRAYRDRLEGEWGVADVEDCVSATRCLTAQGLADSRRVVIRGRSAGGLTALAALVGAPDAFAAAAIYFGIGDLELLLRDTHKFEARYLDWLVGPYPERQDLYRSRSPIHHLDRLACPLIVFQGLADTVVPPEHASAIVAAVRAKGLPVEYVAFPDEGHGFRKAATIVDCLTREAAFYARVLNASSGRTPT
jgi:dipeptidyl aminopeptidase/acylaminoacyl peptidase